MDVLVKSKSIREYKYQDNNVIYIKKRKLNKDSFHPSFPNSPPENEYHINLWKKKFLELNNSLDFSKTIKQ